ncbi:hypothetical protein AX17_003070 [Amanita inopinata Kibby_2008]|nr:hypothetical protein AX17_003070 [Amanita inopinata Kibby_2008]
MRGIHVAQLFALLNCAAAQQIWDIWQTTWDRSKLFTALQLSSPINFKTPSVIGSADIQVEDSVVYQPVLGFGGSLTDSSAYVLNNLKSKNPANYWELLNYLFSPRDGANAAGLSYVRVPLGASDFSSREYSFDDIEGDRSLESFDINSAPPYLFSVLQDIQSVNNILRVHVVPWSPPGWMKDSGKMKGGSLDPSLVDEYANYLFKSVQGFISHGIRPYAISIQNEPQNNNPTYPTATFTPYMEGQVGRSLRNIMDSNGLSGIKLIGYEHNWDTAGDYPVQLMQAAGDAFDGVAFHCYRGNPVQQDDFNARFPDKVPKIVSWRGHSFTTSFKHGKYQSAPELLEAIGGMTSSGIWIICNRIHSDMPTTYTPDSTTAFVLRFIGSVAHNARSGLMWNIALDGIGEPKLPGTNSCGGSGCRAIVQVNDDGTFVVNQEFYAMAQASKAILPRDGGGPWGQRIQVDVGGELNWALRVGAYVTKRVNSSDWDRYSLVVLNWCDSIGGWNPRSVQTTIEFRGRQATYTFPVGVTTLWWYGEGSSSKVKI